MGFYSHYFLKTLYRVFSISSLCDHKKELRDCSLSLCQVFAEVVYFGKRHLSDIATTKYCIMKQKFVAFHGND